MRFNENATLSAICKAEDVNDTDNDNVDSDDDECQIEGAEDVEEEKAFPVCSFGHLFLRACLGDVVLTTPAHTPNVTPQN